jgi:signal transduction histidine kinase/predicted transglutaminase-like cysteine proteinase
MEKEVSCINTKSIFDYVKAHNNGDCSSLLGNLDPEIDALPQAEEFLRDPNNWISCAVASELHRRAKAILNDQQAPYKIARFAIENASLGYIQKVFVKAFWSTKTALRHIQKINDKFNRSKKVELVRVGRNEAVVRLNWDPTMGISRDLCLYNQGNYTFMPLTWGSVPLKLEEVCCAFEGAEYCEYHLRWPARNRFHEILSRFYTSNSVIMETIKEMEADKRIIEQKYEEVNRLNQELNRKIKQLTAMQETGKAILSVLDLDQLLTVIMNLLFSVCQINRAIIMLVNEEKQCLEYIHGVGFDEETSEAIKNYKVPLHRVSNMLVRVTNTGQAEYIPEIEGSSLKKDNILLRQGKPVSAFVVPLITRSKVIGVMATDGVEGKGVPKDSREILEIFAPQIAIAIGNAKLYKNLRDKMEELEHSQALLSRAEKFSFLGNLAARLAHEIKNPMTAIGTFIQLLPHKYDDEEFRRDFYQVAMEETIRVNNLITELLDLVRPKESHFAYGNLHDLIEKMVLLVSPQSRGKRIDISRRFDEAIGQVWMDSEKVKQVILNLLANALDFTPQGGKIEIVTKRQSEKEGHRSAVIEVKDSGVGIPPSDINRVFDPYFTTKHKSSMHKGTGLGLFIAHQHIQDHGGTIEVRSSVNNGATFIVTLPQTVPLQSSQERVKEAHAG